MKKKNSAERLKELMNILDIKQTDIIEKTGIPKSAMSMYISGQRAPRQNRLSLIADAYNINEAWLMGYDVPMERVSDKNTDIDLTGTDTSSQMLFVLGKLLKDGTVTIENAQTGKQTKLSIANGEWSLLENYRTLNDIGQRKANEHVSLLTKIPEYQAPDTSPSDMFLNTIELEPVHNIRRSTYTYYQRLASAGTDEYIFDDVPTDTIEAPYIEHADFIIGVNGDSMEPTYYDGDKVYVEKRQVVEIGEIGIFMVNNECFIKEAGKDGLISHNKKYNLIPGSEHIICVGKVLRKVEEE